jgi:hypothetical protein
MSDKPLAERLQVKNGRNLAVLNAPQGIDAALAAEACTAVQEADVVLLFVADRAQLEVNLEVTLSNLESAAILWVAYPKLTSRLAGDLSRDVIRAAAPAFGLDTVSQIAIDDDWSALRLKFV